ncbi:MAG TPA: hypothetical protein DHV28_07775 [Ignavibacteriales bacterium]|nr:hypothetical protein [Ignavibacteriales bacterium]
MKEQIINNLNNPAQLEKLYRDNKTTFKREFNSLYPEIQGNTAAQLWYERLNFESDEISWGSTTELLLVIIASFIAGVIAKLPQFIGINPDYFYPRNISFVVFPLLTAYFMWKQKTSIKMTFAAAFIILFSVIFINIIPNNDISDTLILACIHLPLFLWSVLGFIFVGDNFNNFQRRLDFLRYNGDLVVMTTIILIAGALLAGITLGLFRLIDIQLQEFYFQYIGIFGFAASPIAATYLVQTNPHLVNKVSPVIAKVFTPLVLATLVIYLIAVIYTGKDPYNDREFLLIFNMLLIGVMAIIFFSIAETSKISKSKISNLMLLGLSIMTIIINGIALSAILFRISEWGITPNRLAVLGGNVLILTNLVLVTYRLFKAVKDHNEIDKVENSIASFLPVYSIWTILVTFIFPVLFNFK